MLTDKTAFHPGVTGQLWGFSFPLLCSVLLCYDLCFSWVDKTLKPQAEALLLALKCCSPCRPGNTFSFITHFEALFLMWRGSQKTFLSLTGILVTLKWKHRIWSKGIVIHGTSGGTVLRKTTYAWTKTEKLIMSGTWKVPRWSHCSRSPVGGEMHYLSTMCRIMLTPACNLHNIPTHWTRSVPLFRWGT